MINKDSFHIGSLNIVQVSYDFFEDPYLKAYIFVRVFYFLLVSKILPLIFLFHLKNLSLMQLLFPFVKLVIDLFLNLEYY